MPMYRWETCSCLASPFEDGQIIVSAGSVDEARTLARAAFMNSDGNWYGRNRGPSAEDMAKLESDLAPSPEEVAVILIQGALA